MQYFYAPQPPPQFVYYYEYTLSGALTPLYEEKTSSVVENVKIGNVPFVFVKYWDEPLDFPIENDKKRRTIILTSSTNITDYLNSVCFKDCNLNVSCFYKQRII
jgi:hypothetical protein